MTRVTPDLSLDRRAVLRAALATPLLLGAAGSLGSCGQEREKPGEVDSAPMVASDVSRDPADPAVAPIAASATDRLGSGMLRALFSAPPTQNVLISPYSIAVALTMTKLGARGETLTAMNAVLGETAKPLAPAFNALGQQLAGSAGEVEWGGGTATIAWSEANSLWGQRGTPWEKPFLDDIARSFGGGMHEVDYAGAREAARADINAWTDAKTAGKIPEIISAQMLTALTRLVLVNAVHVKAPWAKPFETALTQTAPFTRADGSRVEAHMMRGGAGGFRSGTSEPGFRAATLPYAGGAFACIAVLPDPGQEAAVHTLLTRGVRTLLTDRADTTAAALAMPRFSLTYGADLVDSLASLGMGSAFDAGRADFSGMTTAEPLHIGGVAHQATMDVDEEGTEAAAATAVGMEAGSGSVDVLEVVLDRPFYVVLHDTRVHAPLFVGFVADPS